MSGTIIRQSWDVLLEYEYQVRKRAHKLVNDGDCTIRDALAEARRDPALFERYFQARLPYRRELWLQGKQKQ